MAKFFKDVTLPKAFFLGLLLSLCYLSFLQTGPFLPDLTLREDDPFTTLNYFVKNYFLRSQPAHLEEFIVVAIDDESLEKINQRWPWSRSLFGTVLDTLSRQQPKVILYDATFTGASPNPKEDEVLAEAIRKAGNVVLPSSFNDRGRYTPPMEPFGSAASGSLYPVSVREKKWMPSMTLHGENFIWCTPRNPA